MLRFRLLMAIRNLLNDKLNGSLIIGGFAIGFTACILIGLFLLSEHRVNKVFSNSENIYRIYDAKNKTEMLDYSLYPKLWKEYPEIEDACPMEYSSGFPIVVKDAELDVSARLDQIIGTTDNFFDIFSVKVISCLSDKPFAFDKSIVITKSVAKQMYGSINPLGRTLKTDFFEGTITAVIEDLPRMASFQAQLIINTDFEEFRLSQSCNDGKCWYVTPHFVILNKSVVPEQLANKINSSIKDISVHVDSLAFQNIEDIYLSKLQMKDAHAKGNSNVLSVFLAIGILILLLSSINYINFTISRQFSKLKEFGIKKINGANATNLFLGAFIEVSLGIIISACIAILLTALILPHSASLFGKEIHFADVNAGVAVALMLSVIVLVVLMNCMAPVYMFTRFKIIDFLAGSSKHNRKQIGRQVMLTFQMVASIILIASVLTIFKQLEYVKHFNLGFNKEQLVRFDLPYTYESPSTIKEEIGKLPFVVSSTLSDGYPGHVKLRMGSGEGENNFKMHCITISDDYLETMGIKLKDGRKFHRGDQNSACIINEEAYKRFGWNSTENKIYQQGRNGGYQVLGVVEDFNTQSLHAGIEPVALLYRADVPFGTLSVRLAPGNVSLQLKGIEQAWKRILPHEPMYFTFYDQQFQAMYQKEERLARSVSFFSIIAIVLTCMGILGQILLVSFARTKEIGIRKVNGAKISEILTLLNKDFIKWVAIAFVIATPIAWFAMNKWLENFAYKTNLSWWIFALAGLFALAIALLTVSYQSWKAAVKNPVEVLRYE
ncbi:ABC transporter permease [Carboxylicivirga linearis]|uniref:ABC transporter permease n=1 Tax=Carboxylicivirga linearis TaxID=1628157 RepID=A0ABS5JQV6_9BACT|nr:ABC transporter permease [Carboxylicivirga linearis]MBS2097244.1 ABC transporter permease [Carboxylicivirga linearis]